MWKHVNHMLSVKTCVWMERSHEPVSTKINTRVWIERKGG